MRSKIRLSTVIIYGFAIVICFDLFRTDCSAFEEKGEFYPVDINRIPDVLNLIKTKVIYNYERIKTWQGKAEGIMTYGRYRMVEFNLDVKKELLYVNDSPAELVVDANLEGGKRIKITDASRSQISIVGPDFYIHSQPVAGPNNIVLKRTAFRELHQKDCSTCQSSLPFVFDPRSQLKQPMAIIEKSFPLIIKKTHEIGEDKNDVFVKKVEERIKNGVTEYRITEKLKTTIESDDHNYLIMSSIFSSTKGFNIISQESTLHTPTEIKTIQKRTWDYDLIDGTYVLSKTMAQSYTLGTGKSSFYEEISFRDVKINQLISGEVFSYNNLGLKNNDKFIDKIEGKEYKYEDANLIFVADIPALGGGKRDANIPEPNNPPK